MHPANTRFEHVTKTYAGPGGMPVHALRDLSVELPERSGFTALIGPDGAGKSTFLKLLCGLEAPDTGLVSVLGRAPDPDDETLVSRVAFMPQTSGLYRELSCMENLMLFSRLFGLDDGRGRKRALELLRLFGLGPFGARAAGKLSGGMRQKLALACSLLSSPELLLLDEPTVGVDPLSRRELWSVLFERVRSGGQQCIFSTAYIEEAQAADRVLFLYEGRLIAQDTPGGLLEQARGLTWSVDMGALPPEEAKNLQRALMQDVAAVDPTLGWLDAVPRQGRMDLLLAPGRTLPEMKLPERAALIPRDAQLEDIYALLTFQSRKQQDGAATAAGGPVIDVRDVRTHQPQVPPCAAKPVVAEGIRRTFGNFVAVDDTTFDVQAGEIFGLLGPNGAGKTTTFRMLCSLLAASAGRIEIAGCDLKHAKSDARAKIGYVAQKFSLYGRLSVRENLMFFGRSFGLRGQKLKDRVEELLADFGLDGRDSQNAENLPEGAKRNLSIACALIHSPEILFLDEATSGADLAARRALWRRLVDLAHRGTAVVITTHFMEEAEYCDRFLIQDAGRIIALGAPHEIRRQACRVLDGGNPRPSIEEAFIAIVQAGRSSPATAAGGKPA